eukprot:12780473-Alexandrium_andersonii.AAC.1
MHAPSPYLSAASRTACLHRQNTTNGCWAGSAGRGRHWRRIRRHAHVLIPVRAPIRNATISQAEPCTHLKGA